MAISITSLESPSAARDSGGEILVLKGAFPIETIKVSIDGPSGEVECYSAQSGNGNDALRKDETTLEVASPPIVPGTYDIIVRSGVNMDTLVNGITYVNRFWTSKVFEYRKLFPPIFATGPRRLDLVRDLT